MLEEHEIPKTGGDAVVWAICRANAIEKTLVFTADGEELLEEDQQAQIQVWAANAAEQIEAALAEIGYEVTKK